MHLKLNTVLSADVLTLVQYFQHHSFSIFLAVILYTHLTMNDETLQYDFGSPFKVI